MDIEMTFQEIMAEELGSAIELHEVIDDSAIDSLEYLQFILSLEKEFGVKFSEEQLSKARTYADLQALLSFTIQ
jgi:acyl carrier protein